MKKGAGVIVLGEYGPIVVEVQDPLALSYRVEVALLPVGEHLTVPVEQLKGIDYSGLTVHPRNDIVVVVGGEVSQQLMSHTGAQNWEHPAIVVLALGKLEDNSGIGSPPIANVKVHGATRKDDAIELLQQRQQTALGGVGEQWHYLSTGHLDVLDIGGSNVCVGEVRVS